MKWEWGSKTPRELYDLYKSQSPKIETDDNTQEMIIMVGSPASGKSSISKNIATNKKFKIINQDILKTKTKCISECKKELSRGNSVIIDKTNPKISDRLEFINIAKIYNIPVSCVWVDTIDEMCDHLNEYRSRINKSDPVPIIAMRVYRKNFTIPKLNEGLKKIIRTRPQLKFEDKSQFFKWA